MHIQWGLKDVFNVCEVKLYAKEGDQTPVRTLRIETREVRKRNVWSPTYTVYDDSVSGAVIGHFTTMEDVDLLIDKLARGESL